MGIVLKNETALAKMRAAGKIVREVLDAVEAACVPGVTTAKLNQIAERILRKEKALSAFLGYAPHGAPPYPAVLCTSVNRVVVHGIPDDQPLVEGDIVGVDFACYKDGYCADAARTVGVGIISQPARDLLSTTRACLESAIGEVQVGKRLGDVGAAISARAGGYGVVRDFVGHGIGRAMHEPPEVRNYGHPGRGLRLQPGLVLAIEPMLNAGGSGEIRILDDGWTVVTADNSLAAHFEHTVAVTSDGPQILTA